MKKICIIQARMSSTRLPNKVLLPISGKPMLRHVVDRMRKSKLLHDVVIATSKDISDDTIVNYCKTNTITYHRGSLDDVLARYYETAQFYGADLVVRVTADCPLIDASLIDQGIALLISNKRDYVSNLLERTYPRGFDFEVFTFTALKTAYEKAKDQPEREHVTPYIYRTHSQEFTIENIRQKEDNSVYQLTVDTPDDYKLLKLLIEKYHADTLDYKEIISILKTHPELHQINQSVQRKQYGQ